MRPTEQDSYIRGVGAVGADSRRVVRVLGFLVVLALGAVTAYLFASTVSQNSSAENLARSGMAVTATVTGCEGISDGVGMGIEYYDCTARVTSGGQSYSGLLHGSRVPRPSGSQVQAIMVPGDVSTLTLERVAPRSYQAAWVLAAVTILALAALLALVRLASAGRRPFRRRDPALRAT